jgi:hypothetical protein
MMASTSTLRWEDFYDYWRSKHVEGRPPAREDIDPPTQIPQLAANLMIIDILPIGYQYRLVGSTIGERLGAEFTGKAVGSSGQSETIRHEWMRLLDLVRGDQKPRILVAPSPAGGSLTNLMLVFPLVDRAGKVEQLLAGAFFGDKYVKPGSSFDEVIIREIDD